MCWMRENTLITPWLQRQHLLQIQFMSLYLMNNHPGIILGAFHVRVFGVAISKVES